MFNDLKHASVKNIQNKIHGEGNSNADIWSKILMKKRSKFSNDPYMRVKINQQSVVT